MISVSDFHVDFGAFLSLNRGAMVLGSQGCKPLVDRKGKGNRGAMALAGEMPSLRDFMGRFFF